ncbi:hypothetical protein [Myxococcus stipitatus]|uniref:hypothetical protein n=1 Tax=Myxococcus stipitatus TaxID=83455 RepID=UPI0030D4959C
MAEGWKEMISDDLDEADRKVWEQLVEAYSSFGKAGQAFLSPGVNRVGLIRLALRQGMDPAAVRMLESLPVPELQELFPTLLHYASFGHGAVGAFRKAILMIPREWVLERLQKDAPPILDSGGYDEWRRILELCVELDQALTLRIARAASSHGDPDVREVGEDFLERLGEKK